MPLLYCGEFAKFFFDMSVPLLFLILISGLPFDPIDEFPSPCLWFLVIDRPLIIFGDAIVLMGDDPDVA